VVAAAANAVLDVVDDAQLLVEVTDNGEILAEGLRGLGLEGVRGRGLMLAFEIADAPDVARKLLLEQRLVVNATGPTTIRMLPPLTVSRDEIQEALKRLRTGI
jgi:acetylornithine/succinyldiaminopimelate/putrescine aminotransferase